MTVASGEHLRMLWISALFVIAPPILMFVIAGDFGWVEGWLFAGWFVGVCSAVVIWLYRKDPTLFAERLRKPGTAGQDKWDRRWVYVRQAAFVLWIVAMPLDARRFRWSAPFPLGVQIAGAGLMLGSAYLQYSAYRENTFLSPLVRVQRDRGHHVVDTGVYRLVRHPMYLGSILSLLGAPLLLGSFVGLALGALTALLLVARVVSEERLLASQLEGYKEYQREVPYRLLPHVW